MANTGPAERMGDLVKNGVFHLLLIVQFGEGPGEANHTTTRGIRDHDAIADYAALEVATTETARCSIKPEFPDASRSQVFGYEELGEALCFLDVHGYATPLVRCGCSYGMGVPQPTGW